MVVVSKLPHAEYGRNDYREEAPHFTIWFIPLPDPEQSVIF